MTDITIVGGAQYAIDADAIGLITNQNEAGSAGTFIYGITRAALQIDDSVDGFLGKISAKFARLTRVNGSPVWVNVEAVSALGPAVNLSPAARTMIWAGAETEPVTEDLATAKALINAQRKSPL